MPIPRQRIQVRISMTIQNHTGSRKDSNSLSKRSLSEGVVKEMWGTTAMMDDGGAPLPNPQAVRSRDILSGVDCQTSAVLLFYYTSLWTRAER